jgi:hypothetical protein
MVFEPGMSVGARVRFFEEEHAATFLLATVMYLLSLFCMRSAKKETAEMHTSAATRFQALDRRKWARLLWVGIYQRRLRADNAWRGSGGIKDVFVLHFSYRAQHLDAQETAMIPPGAMYHFTRRRTRYGSSR